MWISFWALLIGFALDLCFGDPHWMPHPVRFMGWMIAKLERPLRRLFPETKSGERAAGCLLVVLVLLVSAGIPALLLWLCSLVSPWLQLAVESVMCYQILAVKSLRVESMKVYWKLKQDDLPGSRKAVSMIVGRDTQRLDKTQVAKAAVETVAENTSDGVVAPLLYTALGGPVLGFFYKAVNTMDSMVGYKNDAYLWFGRTAARLDDFCNWIPARISAWLMILSSFFLGLDGRDALRIYRRDRRNHSSPNSAHTEAVCAGALGVQLAGDAVYFGKVVKKPTIGDPDRPVVTEDIRRANRLMTLTAVLGLLACSLVKGVCYFFI